MNKNFAVFLAAALLTSSFAVFANQDESTDIVAYCKLNGLEPYLVDDRDVREPEQGLKIIVFEVAGAKNVQLEPAKDHDKYNLESFKKLMRVWPTVSRAPTTMKFTSGNEHIRRFNLQDTEAFPGVFSHRFFRLSGSLNLNVLSTFDLRDLGEQAVDTEFTMALMGQTPTNSKAELTATCKR